MGLTFKARIVVVDGKGNITREIYGDLSNHSANAAAEDAGRLLGLTGRLMEVFTGTQGATKYTVAYFGPKARRVNVRIYREL